jgi:hypothetical protein
VRLVDNNPSNARRAQSVKEGMVAEPLGRHVHEFDAAGAEIVEAAPNLCLIQ